VREGCGGRRAGFSFVWGTNPKLQGGWYKCESAEVNHRAINATNTVRKNPNGGFSFRSAPSARGALAPVAGTPAGNARRPAICRLSELPLSPHALCAAWRRCWRRSGCRADAYAQHLAIRRGSGERGPQPGRNACSTECYSCSRDGNRYAQWKRNERTRRLLY
jgi:hypothetical protein